MSDDVQQALRAELGRFEAAVAEVNDADALYELQVQYIGKKGSVSKLRSQMGKLEPEARKAFGMAFNEVKKAIEASIEGRKQAIAAAAREADLSRVEDLTMAGSVSSVGSIHPITRTRRELARVFRKLGFDIVDGPHIEHELYNFDKLNIPADHPARDMQDTFFVNGRDGEVDSNLVLRTHTSPVQIRTMLGRKPPIRIVAMGTVFRKDDDATHSPMFHQIEGLCIDKGVTMADLKTTLYRFVNAFFGEDLKVRLRPSFFPFVEPGAEFDMESPFTAKGAPREWIELGGSGMVHPKVLEACDIEPEEYSGWAFGFGIDRMATLLHGVPDLRLLFDGDVRFLEQFPC
ncbi:MAG: phenylalanine--tRNA ligase subunit alpha [Myxococcota bacterium]